jgi:hypothetical protein
LIALIRPGFDELRGVFTVPLAQGITARILTGLGVVVVVVDVRPTVFVELHPGTPTCCAMIAHN